MIQRQDALWTGHDIQITPQFTLKRRYGFKKTCSSAFGSSEWPLGFFSFENLSGVVTPIIDTQTNVYSFTSSAKTSLYTKTGGAGQSSFEDVANILYWVDGKNAKKWNGSTVTNLGIVAPVTAPTLSFVSGSLSPLSGYTYGYCYRNSTDGTLSSMSPASASTGPLTSKNIDLSGDRCTDPQCDKIQIYRTLDGGSEFNFLAEIANPVSGTWSFTDSTADSGLNTDIIAPVAGVNDPPPTGASLIVWHAGRLWVASGNVVYFSAGPDCTNGNGTEAWPIGNNFAVPGDILGMAPANGALILFTKDNAWVITGTDSSTFAAPILWQAGFGIASRNSLTFDGDTLYVLTSRGKLWSIGTSLQEVGFSIQDQLSGITPANAYLAIHSSGTDEGLFVSDGSAKIYRYSNVSNGWDLPIQPVGGCGAIGSIEVATADWRLVMGRPTGSGFALERDLTTWTDDGTAYTASATIGSLTIAPPRHVANLASVLLQAAAAGTYPTLSVMLNEIVDNSILPATFTALPNPVPDPPQLPQSLSLLTKRHDLKAATVPLPTHVQHLQIKLDFIAEAFANEIYGFGLFTND